MRKANGRTRGNQPFDKHATEDKKLMKKCRQDVIYSAGRSESIRLTLVETEDLLPKVVE